MQLGITYYGVQKTLKTEGYHAYHYTRTQHLNENDPVARVRFCRWAIARHEEDNNFLKNVMFTDECLVTNEGIFNLHNYHYYAQENPHVTRSRNFQVCGETEILGFRQFIYRFFLITKYFSIHFEIK